MEAQAPETSRRMFYCCQTGGDVSPLTLSGKLFQVLQRDLFVPRAVCQTVIDHCVLKGNKHSLAADRGEERNEPPAIGLLGKRRSQVGYVSL